MKPERESLTLHLTLLPPAYCFGMFLTNMVNYVVLTDKAYQFWHAPSYPEGWSRLIKWLAFTIHFDCVPSSYRLAIHSSLDAFIVQPQLEKCTHMNAPNTISYVQKNSTIKHEQTPH
ncbi:hypothetical protein PanWU01x14_043450 [Parasponia andersonii]|uniref:Uncharacterized protein n=1 Tax=Parasponia andersonii TaxID=3476 RepID=A0A2P5DQ17_PARAD|nr:hypothetical protein PanWU01x14_043450 [Parasponia andersonii]